VQGDVATITTNPGVPINPDTLLADHGLDPDEWIVTTARPNSWQALAPESEIVTLHQLKVEAKRILPDDVWIPARTDAPLRKPPRARRATKNSPVLVALAGDQHCPHQDEGLEACWLEWCRANQPDEIVGMGDLLNLSKPHSKHRPNLHDRHNDTPAACFQSGHDWWRRTLAASGTKTHASQVAGNHDLRAQISCLEKLPDLYDVKRPGEQHPWWDLEYMLGLDKLGVKYHRPEGEYHSVEVFLADSFSVAHGAKAGPHGGAPRDAAKHEGSRAVGHAHKASITVVVRYRNGSAIQHVHVSVPTMARRDLGYSDTPDSHQGFATLTKHADGTWNAELALYDDRRQQLWWRDQTYTAN
jgi:hypothetical protein